MKFDADEGDRGLVLDATGGDCGLVKRGDTETGEVVVCVMDEAGKLVFDEDEGCMKTRRLKFRPPLQILPLPGNVKEYERTCRKAMPLPE